MATATRRANSGPGYAAHPGYRVDVEACAKRVRVDFAGTTVADSTATRLVLETAHTPVYYFPRADLRMDLLRRNDHHSHCPFKGEASYWSLDVKGRTAENAAWSYEAPYDEVSAIKDLVAFYWDNVERWREEDEEVFVHPRDPHVRIDILASARAVTVTLGGVVIAESRRARFLFETGLPVRHYIPRADVRLDLLEESDRKTACPYKGRARYWSARIGSKLYPDAVWSYPEPVAEAAKIRGYLCFFNERVDEIAVDGVAVAKVPTKWSPR